MTQIDVLPDDALLEIFYFYVDTHPLCEGLLPVERKAAIEEWQLLVHVCRRWRNLVLGSPRRLNLRLHCTSKSLIMDTLDVWPALPLVVDSGGMMGLTSDTDNIIAALGQSHRICQIDLNLGDWILEEVLAAMEVPFPELTDMRVSSIGTEPLIIPDSFLGGSAPRLRTFKLRGAPFPGLPKLLLSATHLVELTLSNRSEYVSPEALAAIISVMPGLRILSLDFESRPAGGWQSRSLPLPKRSILPALNEFNFKGASKYLEDLVTNIDAAQLDEMDITFFDEDEIDFDCPYLVQFIDRSPKLTGREAHVQFYDFSARVELLAQPESRTRKTAISRIGIIPDRQLSFIVQICNSPMHLFSSVEDLYIVYQHRRIFGAIENALWLDLLLPFAAVKNLYLSRDFAPGIAATLQDLVGGRITEVLPSLQNIFVDWLHPLEPYRESIGQFISARQLSGHPIAISFWEKDYLTRLRLGLTSGKGAAVDVMQPWHH